MAKKNNPCIGSDFDNFLKEEGLYAEVNAGAAKKLLAIVSGSGKKQHDQNGTGLKNADKPSCH
jgi:hypothetical protein